MITTYTLPWNRYFSCQKYRFYIAMLIRVCHCDHCRQEKVEKRFEIEHLAANIVVYFPEYQVLNVMLRYIY